MGRTLGFLVLLALAPAPLVSQVLPGVTGRDRGSIRAEFLEAVMRGVRTTVSRLEEAWNGDAAEDAANLYHEDAFLVTADGREVRGRSDVLAYFRATLPLSGSLETSLLDVDASNNMAMTVDRFVLAGSEPGDAERHGLVFTVYVNGGRVWTIRSQVFRPDVGGGS